MKAKVAGELVEVTVREGESVKHGQVLARIDQTEVLARVAARKADVAAARAQLVWAEKNRNTQKALLDKSFISQNAFDNVQSNYDVAIAKLGAAEAGPGGGAEIAGRRGAGGADERHRRAAPRAARRTRAARCQGDHRRRPHAPRTGRIGARRKHRPGQGRSVGGFPRGRLRRARICRAHRAHQSRDHRRIARHHRIRGDRQSAEPCCARDCSPRAA